MQTIKSLRQPLCFKFILQYQNGLLTIIITTIWMKLLTKDSYPLLFKHATLPAHAHVQKLTSCFKSKPDKRNRISHSYHIIIVYNRKCYVTVTLTILDFDLISYLWQSWRPLLYCACLWQSWSGDRALSLVLAGRSRTCSVWTFALPADCAGRP